ncbi:MAG: uracil-DNA glycosylase family protein [Pseudomonadota bacterium]
MTRPPNPIFQVSEDASVLIAGQAPGNLADQSGLPFTDPSGNRLRDWMGLTDAQFYDAKKVAIMPMGFCFPGYDRNGGDLPPIKRCASTWRSHLLKQLPNLQLVLLIGRYAQNWHLPNERRKSLTDIVRDWRRHLEDGLLPIPHPSWRNNRWLVRNPWFETDVIPEMRSRIGSLM